jgi:hypothetical protein
MIFSSRKAYNTYMKKHPEADKSNHKIMPNLIKNEKPIKPHRNIKTIKPTKPKKNKKY